MELKDLTPVVTRFTPYHDATAKRTWQLPPEDREFIAWDGEGKNLDGPDRPQHYVLFGCSAEKENPLTSKYHLHTFEILDYILAVGRRHPTAFHVSFAFNYDAVQIVRSLHENALRQLHETNKLALRRHGTRYFIHYIPSKWFSVSRYGPNYDRKKNPHDKVTVRIFDIFSFFGTSFIKAYEDLVGPVPRVLREGKSGRDDFVNWTDEEIRKYWSVEIGMLRELADELRSRLYGADLRIREWHGPGALANFANKKHGVRKYMAVSPAEVRTAARYAYAGGRFEMFQLGRVSDRAIYSLDINSAYPYGIAQLPNLATGSWIPHIPGGPIARFGVYRIRLLPRPGGSFLQRSPGPLFHRDTNGNISFPWIVDGWYWSPEVRGLVRNLPKGTYEIVEGWEYVGWKDSARPYEWVRDTYALRREWKNAGNPSQLALKLMLNSLYGKMAQRVGWNEERRTPPTWHQLEWAGWVTSNTRAMLWEAMCAILRHDPSGRSIIAVETDGLYTTVHPSIALGGRRGNSSTDLLGSGMAGYPSVESSTELGGWEIERYDEILYVQSGLAWLRKGDTWVCKRRGLDARTFQLDACRDYLRTLVAGGEWAPYIGSAQRFIGLGAGLASSTPTKEIVGRWSKMEREIRPGKGGKRIHVPSQCAACESGLSAWDSTHDMSIRSMAYKPGFSMSREHSIPWENDMKDEWREYGRDKAAS